MSRSYLIYEPTNIDNILSAHKMIEKLWMAQITIYSPFIRCTMLPASLEDLTFAQPGVGPLEAGGEDLADVGEVEEEQRHAHHRVEDGHDLADGRHRHDVAVTCNNSTVI